MSLALKQESVRKEGRERERKAKRGGGSGGEGEEERTQREIDREQ